MNIRRVLAASAAILGLTAAAVGVGISPASAVSTVYRPFSYGLTKGGLLEQFAHGDDGTVVYRYQTGSTTLSDWISLGALPGGVTENALRIGVGNNNLGNLEVYVVGSDGNVYHDYSDNGGTQWSGFSTLGGPASPIWAGGDVAVGSNNFGNQELYVRSVDGNVYHRFATPGEGSGWSGWDTMGQPAAGIKGDVFVGKNNLKNQELYIIGLDGRLYHNFATPGKGSGWNGWDPMDSVPGVTFASDISVGINSVSNQELYFVGSDGNVYHNYATPGQGSGWSSFSSLGAPSGVTLMPEVDVEAYDFHVLGSQRIVVYDKTTGAPYFDRQTPGVGTGWSGWGTTF